MNAGEEKHRVPVNAARGTDNGTHKTTVEQADRDQRTAWDPETLRRLPSLAHAALFGEAPA